MSLFRMGRELYAAASWKSDATNGGKMRFFALEDGHVTAKSVLDFPDTVSVRRTPWPLRCVVMNFCRFHFFRLRLSPHRC